MAENCSHDCSSCGESCPSRDKESLKKAPHPLSKIKKVVAVVSGKGGVGKSMTCVSLALAAQKKGLRVALMDADITGPSIPRMLGLKERAMGNENGILPVETDSGIQVMSMNLLLEKESEPVVWRGSLIAGTVLQFWTDVIWHDVDIMFIDMPPGTGDVPLTIFQSLPLDGIVIVTTPQDLVGMIVEKAVNMAKLMNVPILGMVENMSYITCPDCGRKISVFGDSTVDALALEYGVKATAKTPIDPALTRAADLGATETYTPAYERLSEFFDKVAEQIK